WSSEGRETARNRRRSNGARPGARSPGPPGGSRWRGSPKLVRPSSSCPAARDGEVQDGEPEPEASPARNGYVRSPLRVKTDPPGRCGSSSAGDSRGGRPKVAPPDAFLRGRPPTKPWLGGARERPCYRRRRAD